MLSSNHYILNCFQNKAKMDGAMRAPHCSKIVLTQLKFLEASTLDYSLLVSIVSCCCRIGIASIETLFT